MRKKLIDQNKDAFFLTNYRLQLTIPSVLAEGEIFSLKMTLFGPDGLPYPYCSYSFSLRDSKGIRNLPNLITFSVEDDGQIFIEGLEAIGPDYAYVSARIEGFSFSVFSNPAWVYKNPPFRIFWGDIHVHTTFSNCSPWACKSPEFCYEYARDVTHLDFAAASDHIRGIIAEPARWNHLKELVRMYDESGRFIPLLAYESSHSSGFGGDNNVYFKEFDGDIFLPQKTDIKTAHPKIHLKELWDFLDKKGKSYLTIPHHCGRGDKYRSFADPVYSPEREPLFEIYSWQGSSEVYNNEYPYDFIIGEGPFYFRDAINAGCRYGVMASSDDHKTMPGGEHKQGFPLGNKRLIKYIHHGLTALRIKELTREALWEGMKHKSCYATTFSRMLLDVSIADLSMGQEMKVSKTDTLRNQRKVKVRVMHTEPPSLLNVVLIRNGKILEQTEINQRNDSIIFEDNENLDKVAIKNSLFFPAPFVSYYVKASTPNRQTIWSSPIWFDL
jgi:hypothetical protein